MDILCNIFVAIWDFICDIWCCLVWVLIFVACIPAFIAGALKNGGDMTNKD